MSANEFLERVSEEVSSAAREANSVDGYDFQRVTQGLSGSHRVWLWTKRPVEGDVRAEVMITLRPSAAILGEDPGHYRASLQVLARCWSKGQRIGVIEECVFETLIREGRNYNIKNLSLYIEEAAAESVAFSRKIESVAEYRTALRGRYVR